MITKPASKIKLVRGKLLHAYLASADAEVLSVKMEESILTLECQGMGGQHFNFDVASPEGISLVKGADAMTITEIEPHFFQLEGTLTEGVNRIELQVGK